MKTPLTFIGAIFLLSFAALGQTNEWTKPSSGAWEESYWSLGQLPGPNQDVAIDNYGWKAVAIGPATTANYPQSLSMSTLLIDGPTNSLNTLLLNWAQLSVPLTVQSNLTIGTNGALVSHYSALRAANADIAGTASFMDYATEDFGQLLLRSGGMVGLTNGIMTTSNLLFWTGTFTQSGGSHTVYTIGTQSDRYQDWNRVGVYELQAGTLISTYIDLGSGGDHYPEAHGLIHQTGGAHTNTSIDLWGWAHHWSTSALGAYALEGGLLDSGAVSISCGNFTQTGGTNHIQNLTVNSGGFVLIGGELVTSNESVSLGSEINSTGFYQTGGVHVVHGQLQVNGPSYAQYHSASYKIDGGSLVTSNIIVQSGAFGVSSQGSISNAGIITLTGAFLADWSSSATQYLGRLQLATNHIYWEPSGGAIDLNYNPARTNQTVWRFGDSHALPWVGALQITNWTTDTHVFFGTNAQGLSRAQLDHVIFTDMSGYPVKSFPGMLLPTGELVKLDNTNQWAKTSNGNWEEANWSLGKLPALDQGFVAFNNPGGKTLTISQNTTATAPQSLDVYNLLVDGTPGSPNQLSLNSSGSAVPLNVRWNLTVGTNGAVVAQNSSLQIANTLNYGLIDLRNGTLAEFENLGIVPGGLVNVSDGFLTCSNLGLDGGVLRQTGGDSSVEQIELPMTSSDYDYTYPYVPLWSYYYLQGGSLYSKNLSLGGAIYSRPRAGTFIQSGGIHTNLGIILTYEGTNHGSYLLQGGLLVSDSIDTEGGLFLQSGGTNLVQSLHGYVTYNLSGGELVISNLVPYDFVQSGGRLVAGDLEVHYYDRYELSGGRLVTSNIVIYAGTFVLSGAGVVENAGLLTFPDIPYYYGYIPGRILVANAAATNCFGQLQMAGGGSIDLHDETIQPTTNATVLRFADSHTQPWAAPLQIFHWGARPGDHLYFGTNAQGLTAAQLALIQFVSNGTTNSARLLATGELVPDVPPPMTYTNSGRALVLSWPGGYQLMSATNAAGPYELMPLATSPFTYDFNEPQRFFRLQLPGP